MIISRTFSAILSEATASASCPCPPLANAGGEPLHPRPRLRPPAPAVFASALPPRCDSARLTRCSASSEVSVSAAGFSSHPEPGEKMSFPARSRGPRVGLSCPFPCASALRPLGSEHSS